MPSAKQLIQPALAINTQPAHGITVLLTHILQRPSPPLNSHYQWFSHILPCLVCLRYLEDFSFLGFSWLWTKRGHGQPILCSLPGTSRHYSASPTHPSSTHRCTSYHILRRTSRSGPVQTSRSSLGFGPCSLQDALPYARHQYSPSGK